MAAVTATRVASAPRSANRLAVRTRAATTSTVAAPKATRALDITKRKLIDSYGGRAVRNVGDGEIFEIVYEPANDSVRVLDRARGLEYATEINKENRVLILLDRATPLPGGAPSFAQLQAVLKASGPGPEAINGRLAMLAFLGVAAVELATGQGLVQQAASPAGAGAAAALAAAVAAASLAPLLLGKVRPQAAFPSEGDSYSDRQLPYFWTGLAETINGRAAMVGLAGLLVNEAIRGAPLF